MSSIKTKVRKIKVLFGDVDNTLLYLKLYRPDGSRTIGILDNDDWLKYNIMNNAYERCEAPTGVFNLVKFLHDNGAQIYGLTECTNSFEYNSKFNRLKEVYGSLAFQHHGDLISIDTRHKKVMIMKMMCEKLGLDASEVMFIDDSYYEVMEAAHEGFFSMHTTEVQERFYSKEALYAEQSSYY